MKISYNKLWKLLIDRGLTKTQLMEKAQISTATVAKMSKGQNITTDVLCRICATLNCNVHDIMEFIPQEK